MTPKPRKRAKPKARAKPAPLSLRAYSRLRGCSVEAVRKAIKSGRLVKSVTENARGQSKIVSAELADQEWGANTKKPAATAEPTAPAPDEPDRTCGYPEARRRREVELWHQARVKREADELELQAKRGELVSADEARAAVIDTFAIVRTRLLGVPTRCKQRLPNLSAHDVRVIDDMVREALEELADAGDAADATE